VSEDIPSVEDLSRPTKAFIDAGKVANFGDAAAILAATVPTIAAGPDATSYGHHAALLTAVETTARAFGQAPVFLAPEVAATTCLLPGQRELTVADAVLEAGGHLVENLDVSTPARPTVAIGTVATTGGDLALQVTWDGWVAHIDVAGARLRERGTMVLAPVAAAALAVTECFKRALGTEEACYRTRSLNLWRPELPFKLGEQQDVGGDVLGPDLEYLPKSGWMVGLGHLGQGFAWCWRLLPYEEPGACLVLVQDFDKVNKANKSTGMFIRPGDVGKMKARVVSATLERAGFDTRILERRLLPETRRDDSEPALALVGVDKLEPRRIISDVGWTFAVDVGLGAGPVDFTGISVHAFSGLTSSHEVSAWQKDRSADRGARARAQEPYRNARNEGADDCGLIQLAETAVAAPFVGVVAACLGLAEPLRVLHGQDPHITLTYDSGRAAAPRATRGTDQPRTAYLPARRSESS
jgi:hypothetical protein